MSFSKEHDEHCPTCGEPVPSDYVEQGEDCTPTWSALIRPMYEAYATACTKIAINDLIDESEPFALVSGLTKSTDEQYLNACKVKDDLEGQFISLASGLDSTNEALLESCANETSQRARKNHKVVDAVYDQDEERYLTPAQTKWEEWVREIDVVIRAETVYSDNKKDTVPAWQYHQVRELANQLDYDLVKLLEASK